MQTSFGGVLFLGMLSVLLAACESRDSRLSRQVTGTWLRELESGGTGTYAFTADGTFSFRAEKTNGTTSFFGDWQIEDRVLIMTVTDASNSKARQLIGGVERWNILRADHEHFVFEQTGNTNTMTRQ